MNNSTEDSKRRPENLSKSHESALISLQALPERDLASVVTHLFYALGYHKVEDHSGPYEGGKDLICWRMDELGEPLLAVAQLKRYKFSARARDHKSFMELVNQLQAASETPVPDLDGHARRPEIIYAITPFPVDVRALSTRFTKFSESLRPNRVKIIDGPRLVMLLHKHRPDLLQAYVNRDASIKDAVARHLSNKVLLHALEFLGHKRIDDLYQDLGLVIGATAEGLINKQYFPPRELLLEVKSLPEVDQLRLLDDTISRELGQSLGIDWMECAKQVKESQEERARQLAKATDARARATSSSATIPRVHIDLTKLNAVLDRRYHELENVVAEINQKQTEHHSPHAAMTRAANVLKDIMTISRNPVISSWVPLEDVPGNGSGAKTFSRITIPLGRILDTRANFLLLGEAGAGKTTCLQTYAQRKMEDQEKPVLFVPLVRIIDSSGGAADRASESPAASPLLRLVRSISSFLEKSGAAVDAEGLLDMMRDGDSVLILDGLDEVRDRIPWLVDSIKTLTEEHKEIQVIVSSRMGGVLPGDFDFLGLLLLPFTNQQREEFFAKWFLDESDQLASVLSHLQARPEVAEIVRNPLSATILAVLAESGLDLPRNEIELYGERMNLLLGKYDMYKGTRRLESRSQVLRLVARKLAWRLHDARVRSASRAGLRQLAEEEVGERLSSSAVELAVRELEYPCNVLVPMSESEQVGFGHLQYQEYLAAEEFVRNRSLDIAKRLEVPWWRGTIRFAAQMMDDPEHLLKVGLQESDAMASAGTFQMLVQLMRSPEDRARYEAKVRRAMDLAQEIRRSSSER